jgi:hypothetical protein
MLQIIERAVISFVLTIGVLAAMAYGRAPVGQDAPSMTPGAAPVPRVAPTAEITVVKQTPLPKAGLP